MSLQVFINAWIEIGLISLFNIRVKEVKALEVEHMECLTAHYTDVAIFVEPLLHVFTAFVTTAKFYHLLSRLLQVEFLVVKEAIRLL